MKKYIIIIFVFFHLNSPRLKSYLSPLQFFSLLYQCQNYNIHLTTRNMIAKINTNCTVDVLSLADFADAQIL